jgi:chitinase
VQRILVALVVLLTGSLFSCGGGGSQTTTPAPTPPPAPILVTVSGPTGVLNAAASRTFSATVTNTSNHAVTWSVVETGGGTITQEGVYTAPSLPGTFTVKATAQADNASSGTATVPW